MKKIISIILCIIFVFSAVSVGASAAGADNPSLWTTQQIVEYYKLAASKSNGTSRGSLIGSEENDTATTLGFLFRQIAKTPEYYDGITGDYSKLSAADVKSASARLDGGYVVIDLKAKDQTFNFGDGSRDGSVTHLVDDREYRDFFAEDINPEDVDLRYDFTNSYAKDVKINIATGKIESGRWGFDFVMNGSGVFYRIRYSNLTLKGSYSVEYPFTPTTINSVEFPEEISVRYKDTVTLAPGVDATGEHYNVSYSCSNYNVINVTSKGEVETCRRGTSVVTCTVEGEGGNTVQKDCKVNVYYSRGQWFIMIFLFGWLWY